MTLFALVDANNFYASCEKLFDPTLRHRPVVVLSNNDGCVVARSAEAKALGIPMGTPWFKLQEESRCHGIVALSSNYALYADLSNRVVEVLASFTPNLEVYSIDESFLDLTGFERQGLPDYGAKIRQRIADWLSSPLANRTAAIPCSKFARFACGCSRGGVFECIQPIQANYLSRHLRLRARLRIQSGLGLCRKKQHGELRQKEGYPVWLCRHQRPSQIEF